MPDKTLILQTAKELIKENNYSLARTLLEVIPDNPTASEWLKKLDLMAPHTTEMNNSVDLRQARKETTSQQTKWEYCEVGSSFEKQEKDEEQKQNMWDDYVEAPTGKLFAIVNYFFPDRTEQKMYETIDISIRLTSLDFVHPHARRFAKTVVAKLGMDGWELVQIHHDQSNWAEPVKWYFKRQTNK